MRTVGPRRGHRRSIRPAAVGATCLALLAGSLVAAVGVAGPAEAATIPTNPCVASPGPVSTTRPVLTAVSMSTSTLDVRRRAKKLVVTVRAHDTVALNLVRVRITQWPPKRFAMGVDAHLVAGTAIDGTWRAIVMVPKGVPDGRYRLSTVSLSDTGNGWLTAVPSSLPSGAWPAPFRVRSHTDRTAPTVTGFRVSARAVDTRTGPATIRLRVDVRDDISGVTSVRVEAESAGRRVAPGGMAYDNLDADLTRSATHKNRWTGRAVVPTWAGTSEWTFTVGARDKRRHVRSLSTEKLAARGWQSTLRVTSRRDIVAPSLVALSFSPTSVDARDGDVRVAVTVRVTDTLSGPAAWLPVDFGFPWAAMELTSITGTAHDRTYHGYAVVSQCGIAQESTMRAEVHLSDAAGNRRDVTSDELAALGFATDLSVRQRDSRAPTLGLLSSVAAGDPLALRFSEPVIMTDPLGSLLRVVVDGSTASGSWECRDGSGSVVVCDAEGAAVISSTFTPTTAFASGDRIDVLPTASPPARIGIYDLDGVPLDEIDIQAQLP